MMKARVVWLESMSFVGETGSGHSVVMDGAPEHGGRNLASRPMEMVLLGLGGCTALDVMQILKKGRHAVSSCEVALDAERATEIPAVFTHIHLHYKVSGQALTEGPVSRAIQLSVQKYCSVSAMLAKTAEITHDFKVINK